MPVTGKLKQANVLPPPPDANIMPFEEETGHTIQVILALVSQKK
ncbi:cardiolipin synthetase [Yersinia pestis]|uniref:Cardiolipin synthetase n=1 Tax=Yersinia pestis TaxID=632 RepID=A0AAX2HYE6_YERPE|nr:cardiolipin synthetase [Yersinia pestis]